MGLPMSLNLQKYLQKESLSPLRYSNRTMSKGESLKTAGAIPENGFQDIIKKSDIIFTMVGQRFGIHKKETLNMCPRYPMTMLSMNCSNKPFPYQEI